MGDYLTLDAIKSEINALISQKASGTYFINDHGCAGWIRIREGNIEQLAVENHFNEAALALLTGLKGGEGRFVPGPVFPSRLSPPTEAIQRWLSDSLASKSAAPAGASMPPSESTKESAGAAIDTAADDEALRESIERIALNYFGPIAPVLCAEAWAAHADIESALTHIASNLLDTGEAKRFLNDARAALSKRT